MFILQCPCPCPAKKNTHKKPDRHFLTSGEEHKTPKCKFHVQSYVLDFQKGFILPLLNLNNVRKIHLHFQISDFSRKPQGSNCWQGFLPASDKWYFVTRCSRKNSYVHTPTPLRTSKAKRPQQIPAGSQEGPRNSAPCSFPRPSSVKPQPKLETQTSLLISFL